MATNCTYEPLHSYIDIVGAYYDFSVGLINGNIKFISIADHIKHGNGQNISSNDVLIIIVWTLIFASIKYIHDIWLEKFLKTKWKFLTEQTMNRLTDLCWSTCTSTMTTVWTAYVIFIEAKCVFLMHPSIAWSYEPFSTSNTHLQLSHIGLYIFKMISHIFLEERKPHDHVMLIVHHVVTITLILVSFITRCNGNGMTTLFLHMSTDVLLYGSRFVVTLLPELSRNGIIIRKYVYYILYVVIFIFLSIWVLNRLYLFPIRVIWSMLMQPKEYYVYALAISSYFAGILLVLHVIWTYMLYQYIRKSIERLDFVRDSMREKEF